MTAAFSLAAGASVCPGAQIRPADGVKTGVIAVLLNRRQHTIEKRSLSITDLSCHGLTWPGKVPSGPGRHKVQNKVQNENGRRFSRRPF